MLIQVMMCCFFFVTVYRSDSDRHMNELQEDKKKLEDRVQEVRDCPFR